MSETIHPSGFVHVRGTPCKKSQLLDSTILLALMIVLGAWTPARGQKPPEVGYAFPPVVAIGATTQVDLGGYDWTTDVEILSFSPVVTLKRTGDLGEFIMSPQPYWFGPKGGSTAMPIPREIPFAVSVDESAVEGAYFWQVANANGVSPTAVIRTSRQRQVVEARDRDRPVEVGALPVGVSGRLARIAEQDRYTLVADRDGFVTVRWMARRLGANFHGCLQVRGPSGQLLADVADTAGRDGLVTVPVVAGTRYEVLFFDVDFRGHRSYVYHLSLTYGVPPENDSQALANVELLTSKKGDTPPALSTWNEPPVILAVGNVITKSFQLNSSQELVGRLLATKGDEFELVAYSQQLGTELDLELVVEDEAGKVIGRADDGLRTNDPRLVFKAPNDGLYQVKVSDLSGQGARSNRLAICKVTAEPLAPTVRLTTAQRLAIPVGGTVSITVNAEWLGGFAQAVQLECVGLPNGIRLESPAELKAGAKSAKLSIVADGDVPTQVFSFVIVGKSIATVDSAKPAEATAAETPTADLPGVEQTFEVRATLDGDLVAQRPDDFWTTRLSAATTLKPPIKVELVDRNRQRAVHRGTTYPAPFVIAREDGFDGEVLLQMAAQQSRHRQGIYAPIVTVPANATDVAFPCFMPEWLETNRTTRMMVTGVAIVKDAAGKPRRVLVPADARVTMILEGALLKVSHELENATGQLGGTIDIPVNVARASKLDKPVSVRLEVPDSQRAFVRSDPIILSTEQPTGTLHVSILPEQAGEGGYPSQLTGRWNWQIRAEAKDDLGLPVVSVTDLEIEIVGSK